MLITEKKIYKVDPVPFTADGNTNTIGEFQVADSSLFRVGQIVILLSDTQQPLTVKINRMPPDGSTIMVGPLKQHISKRQDISAYLVADNATIQANEQERPTVPEQEIERHTYEEEPVVARRTILVDKQGCRIDGDNPLPVDATLTVDNINVEIDAKDGDNIAISSHPNQLFDQGSDTITTAAFEEIYSYTSSDDATRLIHVEVTIGTQSRVQLKLDGTLIRERRTSSEERNTVFVFREHKHIPSGSVLTVEAKVNRKFKPSYDTFTSIEGYLDP